MPLKLLRPRPTLFRVSLAPCRTITTSRPLSEEGPVSKNKTILEVERKFPRLAVPSLTQHHQQNPKFSSIQPLPTRQIHDIYYDTPTRQLCSHGAWIRLRDGKWEAKLRRGGDFVNSRFEELTGEAEIVRSVRSILGSQYQSTTGDSIGDRKDRGGRVPNRMEDFGLEKMAEFVTTREAWMCDGEFKVVRDRMDFGHEVGEVELQAEIEVDVDSDKLLLWRHVKEREMERMDCRVKAFMERYAWAFDWSGGEPKGKLTAYFEMVKKKRRKARAGCEGTE
ncbi:hypothetical protein N656DRAFT_564786 [Canariomyces notabilis]|uniref:Thiamine-triphosphatase n=1 Tax=Canariomyces notabilis TaxID=2074819 RepID=A0AAN6T7P3_9PEZI|nr:hypothetical protein N656DRAFT_564786 [Canariomyces arenarius]